jgi:hypothetical protein
MYGRPPGATPGGRGESYVTGWSGARDSCGGAKRGAFQRSPGRIRALADIRRVRSSNLSCEKCGWPSPRRERPIYQGSLASCTIHPVRERSSHHMHSAPAASVKSAVPDDCDGDVRRFRALPSVTAGFNGSRSGGSVHRRTSAGYGPISSPAKIRMAVPSPRATDLPRISGPLHHPSGPRTSVASHPFRTCSLRKGLPSRMIATATTHSAPQSARIPVHARTW